MWRKRGPHSISSGHFDLPIAAVYGQSQEIRRVTQRVDALVHTWDEIEIAPCYCVAFPVVNTELECAIPFEAKTIGDFHSVWTRSMTSSSTTWEISFYSNWRALGSARYIAAFTGLVSSYHTWMPCRAALVLPTSHSTWIWIAITILKIRREMCVIVWCFTSSCQPIFVTLFIFARVWAVIVVSHNYLDGFSAPGW